MTMSLRGFVTAFENLRDGEGRSFRAICVCALTIKAEGRKRDALVGFASLTSALQLSLNCPVKLI